MSNRSKAVSKPIPWNDFETLMRTVHAAAQEPGNESLYRFLAFCVLTAYGGLRTQEVLQLRWERLWLLNTSEVTGAIKFDRGKWIFTMDLAGYLGETLKESRRLARIVVDNNSGNDSKFNKLYVMSNLQSSGKVPMTIQSLNLYLKQVALRYGLPGMNIASTTLRKTYARHEYDVYGHTKKALSNLKQELGHSSAEVTMRFIS